MSKFDEQFLPERVDEQIDALAHSGEDIAQSPGSRLLAELQAIYQEDEEIVRLVWKRLAGHTASKESAQQAEVDSRALHRTQEHAQKGPQTMQSSLTPKPQKRKRSHWLEILAAVLAVVILVGGMALLLKSRQSSLAGGHASTPTPAARTASPTAVVSASGLYLTTSNGIYRVDRSSGKVVWHVSSGITNSLLVEGNIVIFSGGDTAGPGNYSNYYVEAVNAENGHRIWRQPYDMVYTLLGANGIVVVDSCPADFSSASPCTIDGLKTSDGHKLWSYPSALGSIWDTYQDGVIYGVSYKNFFALKLSTGTPLWQKTLQKYPNQEATIKPFVSGKELYFSTCNETKQTPTYLQCYFFAFNAASGEELWHRQIKNSGGLSSTVPTVMDGVVYVASMQGPIYALDAATGAVLWTYPLNGYIFNDLLSSQGMLYAEVQVNPTTALLLALKVSRSLHSPVWSQSVSLTESPENTEMLSLQGELIYQLDSHNNILAFNAANGHKAPGFHPAATGSIGSFTFVS
jgi:outer membrane protein assembly factor BamB